MRSRNGPYVRTVAAVCLIGVFSGWITWLGATGGAATGELGLTTNSRGMVLRNGQPYRGIGVNYYDAFLRCLRDPNDDSYSAGLRELGAHGIPFARLAACGYYPSDYRLYLTDKEAYFRRMDEVVRAAEQSQVGLIPSLFWYFTTISDLVHEPRNQWGNPNSRTRQFMRDYTKEFVTRYAASPAIWGWEFACEIPLAIDLPNPGMHLPPVYPQYGTPSTRSERDIITYSDFKSAALDFATTVRSIDKSRILLTGNALPRPTAYHYARHEGNVRDTEAEFGEMLLRDNPGPFNPICIHGGVSNPTGYFGDRAVTYAELLRACVDEAQTGGKSVYVEEFVAVPKQLEGASAEEQAAQFQNTLAAVESSGAPIASVWLYDRKLAGGPTLTFNNRFAYMLRMIADFDRSVHATN